MADQILFGNLELRSEASQGTTTATPLSVARADEGMINPLAQIKMFGAGANSLQGVIAFGTVNNGLFDGPLEEHMRIHINGNVGIGTSIPGAKLSVKGIPQFQIQGVSIMAGSPIVTGSGTLFEQQVAVGDTINIEGEKKTVITVTNNLSLTVDSNFSKNTSESTMTVLPNIIRADNNLGIVKFIISNDGWVGIGKTTPEAKLEVSGDTTNPIFIVNTQGSTSNPRTFTIRNNGQGIIGFSQYPGAWTSALAIQNNNNTRQLWMSPLDSATNVNARIRTAGTGLDFYVGGTTTDTGTLALSLNPNGNVGIGMTTLGMFKLDINNQGNNGLRVSDNGGPGIELSNIAATGRNRIISYNRNTNTYQDLYFGTTASENTLYLANSGNVGIGTTDPKGKLSVMQTVAGLTTGLQISSHHTPGIVAGAIINAFDDGGVTVRGLTLQSNGGNVSIGTTNPDPSARLHVAGINPLNAILGDKSVSLWSDLLFYTDSGNGQIWKSGSGYSGWGGASALNIYNSNGAIAFHPNNTANALYIASSGNVGIGKITPEAKLEVSGDTTNPIFIVNTQGSASNPRTFTIRNNGQGIIGFGSYPGAWTSALAIQNNNNTRQLWMSPLDSATNVNARIRAAGTGLDLYVGGTTTDTGTLALSLNPNGNVGIGGTLTISNRSFVPVYRYFNGASGDHFYTQSKSEGDDAVRNAGYTYEGIAFYAFM